MDDYQEFQPATPGFDDLYDAGEDEDWAQYAIPADFIPLEQWADGPVIAAAGLANSSKLRFFIDRAYYLESEEDRLKYVADQANHFNTGTTVLRAIERQRDENVRLLLEEGANPNGVPLDKQVDMARRFRRFCNEDPDANPFESVRWNMNYMDVFLNDDEVGPVPSQTDPPYLRDDELVDRSKHFSPFWAAPHCLELDFSMDEALYHSVVMAGLATPEILDQLLEAGADTSAWREPLAHSLPHEAELLPSQLCISTPLHTAIATGNMTMLNALLDRGLSPNARAIITGSQALTPMQYAIVIGDIETYFLLRDKGADPDIRTPVFNVHVLHFAAAMLSIELLKAVGMPLSKASTTTMDHTLLHIIALPFNRSEIEATAPKIKQSIHDERGMAASERVRSYMTTKWDKHGLGYSEGEPYRIYTAESEARFTENCRWGGTEQCHRGKNPKKWVRWAKDSAGDALRQEAVCKFLLKELDASMIGLPDKHGNTMLHYLAGAKAPNMPLIDWLELQGDGASVWRQAENRWGYTPQELYDDGRIARNEFRTSRM